MGALSFGLGVFGVLYKGASEATWVPTVAALALFAGVTLGLPAVVPLAVRTLRPALSRTFGTVGRLAAEALDKNPARTTFTVAALVVSGAMVIGVGNGLDSYAAAGQSQLRVERQDNRPESDHAY